MKKFVALCLFLVMVLALTSCDSSRHEGEAKTPSASSVQKGREYESVVEEFKEHGFTNIKLIGLDDLVTGWFTKEGEVESVSVDGDVDYSSDTWYPNDVEVIITYHTFPDEETTDTSTSQEPTTSEPSAPADESTIEIFTVNNCEELVAILALKAEIDPTYSDFAEKYNDKIIEFDGCITYIVNHEDYDTRYDILISAGDYVDENTSNPGPIFKLEDVGVYDLGIEELYLPAFVSVGSNIRIRAKVDEFNTNSGIFGLDPVSIEAR